MWGCLTTKSHNESAWRVCQLAIEKRGRNREGGAARSSTRLRGWWVEGVPRRSKAQKNSTLSTTSAIVAHVRASARGPLTRMLARGGAHDGWKMSSLRSGAVTAAVGRRQENLGGAAAVPAPNQNAGPCRRPNKIVLLRPPAEAGAGVGGPPDAWRGQPQTTVSETVTVFNVSHRLRGL